MKSNITRQAKQLVDQVLKEARGGAPSGKEMSAQEALAFLASKGINTKNGREVGKGCFRYYTQITGLPVSARSEEGYYPGVIEELQELFYDKDPADPDPVDEGFNEESQLRGEDDAGFEDTRGGASLEDQVLKETYHRDGNLYDNFKRGDRIVHKELGRGTINFCKTATEADRQFYTGSYEFTVDMPVCSVNWDSGGGTNKLVCTLDLDLADDPS